MFTTIGTTAEPTCAPYTKMTLLQCLRASAFASLALKPPGLAESERRLVSPTRILWLSGLWTDRKPLARFGEFRALSPVDFRSCGWSRIVVVLNPAKRNDYDFRAMLLIKDVFGGLRQKPPHKFMQKETATVSQRGAS
jgi:hypothetical protein